MPKPAAKSIRLLGISWEGQHNCSLNFLPPAERLLFGTRLEKSFMRRWLRLPRELKQLRQSLRKADVVLLPSRSWFFWRRLYYQRPGRLFPWFRLATKVIRDPSRLVEALIPWQLNRMARPQIIVSRGDHPSMGYPNYLAHSLALLTFMRELPVNHYRAFAPSYNGEKIPIGLPWNKKIQLDASKIRPISIGIPDEEAVRILDLRKIQGQSEKKWDLFYAGVPSNWERVRVRTDLEKLQQLGLRLRLCEMLPFDQYVMTVAQSWLVLSPPGNGYDCYRNYEIPLAGSVPLLAAPNIFRYRPLRHGLEAWYYQPDISDFVRIVQMALTDKQRLLRMNRLGCYRVMKYHRWSCLTEHIRRETAKIM